MFRLRVCYRKSGRLRFLGHLEVCGALERAVRRARLPVACSQGFNPKPKMAYGPALPVGVASEREYVDIRLDRHVPPDEAVSALQAASPEDLGVIEALYVGDRLPSLAAQVAVAAYEVEFVGLGPDARPGLEEGIDRLVAMKELTVERRDKVRTYDLSVAFFRRPALREGPGGYLVLEEWLRLKDQAPVRPDAVAREVVASVDEEHYLRVTRMECYSMGDDRLVSMSEVA